MNIIRNILSVVLFFTTVITHAQEYKRTQNWYFGDKAGLSFATNPPTLLTDGVMGAIEGCATISDTNGNLLFYSHGNSVWDRTHQLMPNGDGLLGHGSSTQAALIVPQPGNDSFFYVFTTAQTGQPNGFRYSIVNMNKNGGLGDVTIKNILLQTPVCEKLTATKHANGKDIWVLAHGFGNDLFYAYLVTENGIVSCPVISKIGSVHAGFAGSAAQGEMKVSFDGRIIAVCVYTSDIIEFFRFDKSQGIVDSLQYTLSVQLPFNIEFSNSMNEFYVTNRRNYLYQFDLTKPDQTSINNSRITVYTPPNTVHAYYTGLQMAVDNKIYAALVDSAFIGALDYPDSSGTACAFKEKAIGITPKRSLYGLPNFVSSYFYKPSADFGYELNCETNTAIFTAKDTIGASIYKWNISKTGPQNFSGNVLVYQFADTGNYTIEFLAINGTDTARQSKEIFIHPVFLLDLGNDTLLCYGQSLLLNAGSGQHCYLWNDGGAGATFTADTSGFYWVKVVSKGFCTFYDTIQIDLIQPADSVIVISRTADTLTASGNFSKYQWYRNNVLVQDSTANYFHLNKQKGTFKVIGTDSLHCFPITSNYLLVDTLTGIIDLSKEEFSIYPNPVMDGQILSVSSGQLPIDHIRLYTIEGKVVFEDYISENAKQYDLDHLRSGIYILNINQLFNYKIILK